MVSHASAAALTQPGEPTSRVEYFRGFNSLRLAADVYGPTGAPPVLLVPGAGQTRHSWRRVATRIIALGAQAIALDLRGHGQSDWAKDRDYSIAAFTGDLEAVLASLNTPTVVVGASLGGIASLLATAADTDNRIAGLALVDVVPDMRPEGLARIRNFMTSGMDGFSSVSEAADAVARYLPGRTASKSLEGLQRNLREASDGRWYWHWDPAFHNRSRTNPGDDMLGKMERAAPNVHVPTLLVTGSHSEVVDEQGARRLLDLIPQAEWFSVADARHMVAGDQNDIFSDALTSFVKRCFRSPAI
jgi:pimeloyl-ACP methyl ester carboxylesterase